MNNLVVDIGNSSVKLGVFQKRELVFEQTSQQLTAAMLSQLCVQFQVKNSLISTVKNEISDLEQCLMAQSRYIRFSHTTPVPIQNLYESPHTLGLDRLAALVAVSAVCPQKNTLVIDAGTCITYDMLTADSRYFGGSISPGLTMRLKALHECTGRLPLVALDINFSELVGRTTEQSILSGVLQGTLGELVSIIEKYQQRYSDVRVVLCGGDAHFFDTQLKNSIFAGNVSLIPNLVLIGLNEIIHHQHD